MRKGKEIDLLVLMRAKARAAVLASYPTDTVSGPVASFPDGADDVPVADLKVSILPVQEGSGDPSPSNVRPISGWTEAKVTRTGKNLLVPGISAKTVNGVTYTPYPDGSVKAAGTPTGNTAIGSESFTLPAGTYILSGAPENSANSVLDIFLYDNNGAVIARSYHNSPSDHFTLTESTSLSYVLRVRSSAVATAYNATFYPMIRIADESDESFEPYNGTVYTILLPEEAGTVYGGTLDVTTGVLTVDRAMVTKTWGQGTNQTVVSDNLTSRDLFLDSTNVGGYPIQQRVAMCSAAPYGESGTVVRFFISPYSFVARMVLPTDTTDDLAIQVVWGLADPVTYQLTLTEVKTLLGDNNIWADTGDVEVEYRADLEKYIEKKIGEADAGTLGLSLGAATSVIRPSAGLEMQPLGLDDAGEDYLGELPDADEYLGDLEDDEDSYPEDTEEEDTEEEKLTEEPEEETDDDETGE